MKKKEETGTGTHTISFFSSSLSFHKIFSLLLLLLHKTMPTKTTTTTKNATTNDLIFLNLTCNRAIVLEEEEHHHHHHQELPSTHDAAEMMLYAFVDSAPLVADLLWSKQQLKQGEFLTLTPVGEQQQQEWSYSDMDVENGTSTHEPQLY